MSLRILITGAAGFVGSAVARTARARGHEVLGLDRRKVPNLDEIIVADVTDTARLVELAEDCDSLIHCAAIVGPTPAMVDPVLATHVNIGGTLAVLEAARATGRRAVCLSTATLYGNDKSLLMNDETARPDPVGIYDATKLMAETLCQAYRKSFSTDVASIRTSFVYGPGHSTGDYFVGRCLAGEKAISGPGRDHPCEFTYVNDLALGLVLAAEAPNLNHDIYNIAAGAIRTRGELAQITMSAFPDVTIDLSEGIDPGRHLRGPCCIDRAREDLQFVPKYSLEDGIAEWVRVARS